MTEPDSQLHRYVFCRAVSDAWITVREFIESVDPDLIFESDHSILHLQYQSSPRENAILWLVGEYVSQVESEAVLKNNKLTRKKITDYLVSRELECRQMSLPELGFIPGLSATGIG